MKKLLVLVMCFLSLSVVASAVAHASPTTWYVRSDGGTRYSLSNQNGECNGTTDAAYPGAGINQPCALSDPRFLYSTGSYLPYKWIISGGDTVILRGGPVADRAGHFCELRTFFELLFG